MRARAPFHAGGRIRRALHAAALVSLLAANGPSLADGSEHHPMRFEQITLDDGLSQSNVFTILQDSDGLMWFGTENGLNRFDGYDFTVFKRERGNSEALVSDYVYDLAEDGGGNLWMVTNGGGLAMMDRKSKTFTSFRHDPADANGISSNVVRSLLIDTDGTIWLGTRGAGLDRFDPETREFNNYRF